jgi:ComF family protein
VFWGAKETCPKSEDAAILSQRNSYVEISPVRYACMPMLFRLPALKPLIRRSLDSLLPRHCLLCGLRSGEGHLCPPCALELPRIERGCELCGLPMTLASDRVCAGCLRRPPPWDGAVAALAYEFPVDHMVRRFKFKRNLAAGQVLGGALLERLRKSGTERPDRIVPVPLHRVRHVLRGFNQAESLARQLGSGLELPVSTHILVRSRWTAPQSGLGSRGRKRNLKGAFRVRADPAIGHVALVDDVLTTGATLSECTRTLKRHGVRRVSIWIAAVTPKGR